MIFIDLKDSLIVFVWNWVIHLRFADIYEWMKMEVFARVGTLLIDYISMDLVDFLFWEHKRSKCANSEFRVLNNELEPW